MDNIKYYVIQTDGIPHHVPMTAAGLCFLYHTPGVNDIQWSYSANLFVKGKPYEYLYIANRDKNSPSFAEARDIFVHEDGKFIPLVEAKYFNKSHMDYWGDSVFHYTNHHEGHMEKCEMH